METKSRALGHSSMHSSPVSEETTGSPTESVNRDNPEFLKAWLEEFASQYKVAGSRKARCEKLMRRRSAKKWSPEKTARMVRRLMSANKLVEQSENALDNITHRLSQQGIEVSVESQASLS